MAAGSASRRPRAATSCSTSRARSAAGEPERLWRVGPPFIGAKRAPRSDELFSEFFCVAFLFFFHWEGCLDGAHGQSLRQYFVVGKVCRFHRCIVAEGGMARSGTLVQRGPPRRRCFCFGRTRGGGSVVSRICGRSSLAPQRDS